MKRNQRLKGSIRPNSTSLNVPPNHSVKNIFCAEQSADGSLIFLGGNTPPNLHSSRGTAIIASYNFNSELKKRHQLLIPEHNATVVNCVKRVLEQPSYLLLGCLKCLVVVKATADGLSLALCMPYLHSNVVSDILINGRSIVTAGKGDSYISLITY